MSNKEIRGKFSFNESNNKEVHSCFVCICGTLRASRQPD